MTIQQPPKKMIKVNGIMKLNPEYTKWKKMQESGGGQPEAQIAVTDATGIPMVSATPIDDNTPPPQPQPTITTGAASGYNAPGMVQHQHPQQHEPMSTVPSPHGGGGYTSPANYAPTPPPHPHHHPPPPPAGGHPPGQRPPQYLGKFGSRPVELTCPHCHRQTRTRTDEVIGLGTIIAIFLLLFFFWPLFWLPLVIPDCKQMDHYCPLCGAKVGEKPSSCCSDGCC